MADEGKKKILVVDDEPDAVEFVKTVMEEAGYDVVTAGNGNQGLAQARAEKPDLIVLDVQMPEKDGFSTFADLQNDADLKAVPVVMLTGVAEKTGIAFSSKDMGGYFGAEPAAYVEKPVDPDLLSQTVARLLEPEE